MDKMYDAVREPTDLEQLASRIAECVSVTTTRHQTLRQVTGERDAAEAAYDEARGELISLQEKFQELLNRDDPRNQPRPVSGIAIGR